MTLAQFRLYSEVAQRQEARAFKRAIVAARLAQAEEKHLRKVLDQLPD
jgi:hypothetical protein